MTERNAVRDIGVESEDGEAGHRQVRLGNGGAASVPADEAAAFLKTMAHDGRLKILCHLAEGERSVTELEMLIGSRQAAVSQQLARLRLEKVVSARRDGKAVIYRVSDERTLRLVRLLHDIFCSDGDVNQSGTGSRPS